MRRTGALFAAVMAFGGLSGAAAAPAVAATGPQPPVVTVLEPSTGAVYSTNWEILVYADVSDPDGAITKVEFYDGSTLLATDDAGPLYYHIIRPRTAEPGQHVLTVKAYDDQGLVTTSPEVAVTVREPRLLTLTGTVTPGVEHGCLLLNTEPRTSGARPYLLLGGDRTVITAGARLEVVGEVMAGVASICMQGTPLRVESATPLDARTP